MKTQANSKAFVGCTVNAKDQSSVGTVNAKDQSSIGTSNTKSILSIGTVNAKSQSSGCTGKGNGKLSSGTSKANNGLIKVIERPMQSKRYSLLDYSIAKTVLGNMGSWSAVGIESGSISGDCLWDSSLVQWATDVCLFFDNLFTRARFFLKANKGILRWCDCVALAWKAINKVKYLTEKLGHVVKEFRPIQAIRSAKHKIRATARKVSNRMYRELFLVDEPVREFTRLQNGLSLRKYDF